MDCYFKEHPFCKGSLTNIKETSTNRIITASKKRGDELYQNLDPDTTVKSHKDCISTYTSSLHITRYLKKHQKQSPITPHSPKRKKRRETRQFIFKEHCIFCGQDCPLTPNPRHPERWDKASLCRTSDRGDTEKTFKEAILNVCKLRNDQWGYEIELRLSGATADLHAADGRYHRKCYQKFVKPKYCSTESSSSNISDTDNTAALHACITEMKKDTSQIWNSVNLHQVHINHGGKLQRRQFMNTITDILENEYVVLSVHSYASIFIHKSSASHLIKLSKDEDTDDIQRAVKTIASTIVNECSENVPAKDCYKTRLTNDIASAPVSGTLSCVLHNISKKLDEDSLPSIMIGNIITSIVTNIYTPLQMALGVLLRTPSMIDPMADFKVCAPYHEVIRFKASAAAATAKKSSEEGLFSETDGLIQFMSDNFDANINSPNDLKTSLPMLLHF